MKKVLGRLNIGNDTVIAVDDPCEELRSGSVVLDENGKQYVILSIGTNCGNNVDRNITNILIEGVFQSEKIFLSKEIREEENCDNTDR